MRVLFDNSQRMKQVQSTVAKKKQPYDEFIIRIMDYFTAVELEKINKDDMYQNILSLLFLIYKAELLGIIEVKNRKTFLNIEKIEENLDYLEMLVESYEFHLYIWNRQ